MGGEHGAGGFQEGRLPLVVGVEEGQEFACGQGGADIAGPARPCIGLLHQLDRRQV